MRESSRFPTTWPGSQPLSQTAPTVHVLPIQVAGEADQPAADADQGLPTAAVLSALFVKHLQVNGVNAALEPKDAALVQYLLSCSVPQLAYEAGERASKDRRYQAELACALMDAHTQQAVWHRTLRQRYDKTTVLDFMTKLPPSVHEDERIMYRECIVPLWDAMAQSVGTAVTSRQQMRASAEAQRQ